MKKLCTTLLSLLFALALFSQTQQFDLGAKLHTQAEYAQLPKADLSDLSRFSRQQNVFRVGASTMLIAPPIGNQGSGGSCVGWSVGYTALGVLMYPSYNDWNTARRSPNYVYNQIKGSGGCEVGSYVNDALDLVVKQGDCSYNSMPYVNGDCTTFPNSSQTSEAAQNKALKWATLSSNDVSGMKGAIDLGLPVPIAFQVTTAFDDMWRNGGQWTSNYGSSRGGHCTCIVGYDDSNNKFKVQNQWGNGGDGGYFWVTYSMVQGGCLSEAYILYPVSASPTVCPTISQQPTSQTTTVGGTATFSVTAANAKGFQWMKSLDGGANWQNSDASGNATATQSVSSASASWNGTKYKVVINGGTNCTLVTSNIVTLTVSSTTNCPTISQQPSSQTTTVGGTATFSVTAANVKGFQWMKSLDGGASWQNSAASGNATATLNLNGANSVWNGTKYKVVINGGTNCTLVTSNIVTLTVVSTTNCPTITQQPTSQTAVNGNATFSVSTTNATGFQWMKSLDGGANWQNSGANGITTAILNLSGANSVWSGTKYKVVINGGTNCTLVTSNIVTLTVSSTTNCPTITQQPTSQTAVNGYATFSVFATNATGFQWMKSLDGGANWQNSGASGNTTATLNLSGANSVWSGIKYKVVINGGINCAPVTSNIVVLTVLRQALDITQNGADSLMGTKPSVFPNPATNTIRLSNVDPSAAIEIYNAIGVRVASYSHKRPSGGLDVSNLSSGVYFLKITDLKGQVSSLKFIKN